MSEPFDARELARVDAAIAAFDRTVGAIDDLVLLLLRRADLAGIPLTVEQAGAVLGISEEEALDIFARLSERGLIEDAGESHSQAKAGA